MHHWRVHAKVEFPRLPPDVRTGGSIIFHHVHAKSELKNFRWDPGQTVGSIIFHHVQAKSQLKFFRQDPGQMDRFNHLSTFDADLRNVIFALISFMGFPALSSALQTFQMCIYNRKYSEWTFSHDSQLMGNRFMANVYASLESTCKSRISKVATRCQNWGVTHLWLCPG